LIEDDDSFANRVGNGIDVEVLMDCLK